MSGNTLKFYWLFLLALIIAGTLISRDACAAKWDDKSPMWLYQDSIKMTLLVEDKMEKLDNKKPHYIQYIVTFQKGGGKFIAERVYDFSNPDKNSVTYPDDFHLLKASSIRAIPIYGSSKVNWQIYIDGVLNASGVAGTQIRASTVNGHLINVKGK